jgi:DNA-binding transcriptional LysR family regulator
LAPFLLPSILEQFARAHPNVVVDVQEGSQPELQNGLRDGSCELALLYNVNLATDVASDPLFAVAPSVLLSKAHPLAGKPNLRLSQMGDEPMVLFDVPPSRQKVEEILRLSGVDPPLRFRSSNFELVRALVGRGEGFAIMYQLPVSNLTYDGLQLVARRLDSPKYAVSVSLCASKDYRPTARSRAFRTFCQQSISSPSPIR